MLQLHFEILPPHVSLARSYHLGQLPSAFCSAVWLAAYSKAASLPEALFSTLLLLFFNWKLTLCPYHWGQRQFMLSLGGIILFTLSSHLLDPLFRLSETARHLQSLQTWHARSTLSLEVLLWLLWAVGGDNSFCWLAHSYPGDAAMPSASQLYISRKWLVGYRNREIHPKRNRLSVGK